MAVSEWKRKPHEFVVLTPKIDLSVSAEYPVYPCGDLPVAWGAPNGSGAVLVVKRIYFMYSATVANPNTNGIRVGNETNTYAITTYTPVTTAAPHVDVLDQSSFDAEARYFNSQKWAQVAVVAGSMTGTVQVGLVLTPDYTEWDGFTP